MKTRCSRFLLGCLLSLAWISSPASAEEVRVVCPAVRIDDRPHANEDVPPQPELVVLGKVREVKKTMFAPVFEVTVEKVLYGNWKGKTVRYVRYPGRYGSDSLIVLSPTNYVGIPPFALHYTVNPAEENAMRALFAARLDYNTLASKCIFIGKEVAAPEDHERTVEIIRPLQGKGLTKGQQVTVAMRGVGNWEGARPALCSEPEIYFIREVHGKTYYQSTRQPVDREAAVVRGPETSERIPHR